MSKLIVLSGVPGSGKSYLCNLLKKIKQKHVYIVSSDNLRVEICGDRQDLSEDKLMWKMFYETPKVYALDKDAIVLLDACHATSEIRTTRIKDLIPLFDEVSLVMFDLDHDLVCNQNIRREYPVPQSVLDNFFNFFKPVDDVDRATFKHIYVIKNINELATLMDTI